MDFPQKALEWLLPDIPANLGKLRKVVFVRQEPRKRRLTDAHLSLDMPVLYTFENGQVLLWLVEFQEDKKLYRYLCRYS